MTRDVPGTMSSPTAATASTAGNGNLNPPTPTKTRTITGIAVHGRAATTGLAILAAVAATRPAAAAPRPSSMSGARPTAPKRSFRVARPITIATGAAIRPARQAKAPFTPA